VPGHGHVGDADELRRRLALDAAYLDAVASGKPTDDPRLADCGLDAGHARGAGALLPAVVM
jgi:hypothetical protein